MTDLLFEKLQSYITQQHPGAVISDFYLLSGGWECDIYAFTLTSADGKSRDLILRLFLGNDGVEKTRLESAGLRQLFRAGYPVPEMFLAEVDENVIGKAFILMEKFEGGSLWAALLRVESAAEDYLLDQFGRLVARLHQLDWRPFTQQAALYEANPIAVMDDWLDVSRRLYTEFEVGGFLQVIDWLDAQKKEIVFQPSVVHLDFHANNVLINEAHQIRVIDWSQLKVADYRCDLSWTLMIMGDNGSPGWYEKILTAYTRAMGQPVPHLDYFNVISYLKLLASTVISLKVGTEKLGMRPQNEDTRREQAVYLENISLRLKDVTGITVPEVQAALNTFTP